MGQYHLLVNVDKEEFVSPHRLGDGLKLLEQLGSQYGVPQAMHVLMCAAPCRRGGGDYEQPEHIREKVVGRWAGDRVVLIGDYAQSDDLPPDFDAGALYEKCDGETFADITPAVAEALEYLLDVLTAPALFTMKSPARPAVGLAASLRAPSFAGTPVLTTGPISTASPRMGPRCSPPSCRKGPPRMTFFRPPTQWGADRWPRTTTATAAARIRQGPSSCTPSAAGAI